MRISSARLEDDHASVGGFVPAVGVVVRLVEHLEFVRVDPAFEERA